MFYTTAYQKQKNIIASIEIKPNKLFITPEKSFCTRFLRDTQFYVEYERPINLTRLPFAIVTMPFVMCMMPIIWASNDTWSIDVMDQDLYESLESIRQIFKLMYPSLSWSGNLVPKKLRKHTADQQLSTKYVTILFSGGLDAVCSSFMHRDKKQLLITIQGYDIPFGKTTMWHSVQQQCVQFCQSYGHDLTFIRFNFRSLVDVHKLAKLSPEIPVWIEYTSEALSHIGVTAPILYQCGYKKIYMASSVTIEYPFPYGTHPAIDNFIRFAGIQAQHDGDHLSRLEKLHKVKTIAEIKGIAKPALRVCWGKDREGGNCCRCEKCLRTMYEILALGEDLATWGFDCSLKQLKKATERFLKKRPYIGSNWLEAQDFIKNSPKSLYPRKAKPLLDWFIALDLQKLHHKSERYEVRRSFFEDVWRAAQKKDLASILSLQ